MKKHLFHKFTLFACFAWLTYWLLIQIFQLSDLHRDIFTDSYGALALIGSVFGLRVAKKWGGWSSYLGKSMLLFSAGLFFQFLDQIIYSIYYYATGDDLVFPNVGDIPYILSGISYVYATYVLLRVIKPIKNRFSPAWVPLMSVLVGVVALALMYVGFIQYSVPDERGLIYSVLNVLYPILQAVYFVLGLCALFQSRLVTGGRMFRSLLSLIIALGTQFAANYFFLYESYHDNWTAAGASDLLYAIAYCTLTLSMYLIDHTRENLAKQGGES